MKQDEQKRRPENEGQGSGTEKKSSSPNDLPDNPSDASRLESEETYIDLPDVKDIPGQEFVHAPPAGMMADTTISSDDEEGKNVFDRDEATDTRSGTRGDVGKDERRALEDEDYMPTRDGENLKRSRMDNQDFEGDNLNEGGFRSE